MIRPTVREVFNGLVAQELLAAEDEPRLRERLEARVQAETAWYLKLLMGVGAWVATGLFLLFLVIADVLRSEAVSLALGAVMVTVAVAIRWSTSSTLGAQAALAISFVGQLLMVFGVGELASDESGALVLLMLSLGLLWGFRDPVHRFVSTLGAVGAFGYLLWSWTPETFAANAGITLLTAVTVAFWLRRPVLRGEEGALQGPVGHGLAVSLLAASVPLSWGIEELAFARGGTFALGAAALFVEGWLLGLPRRRPDVLVFATLGATLVVAVLTFRVPGIQAALVLMLLAMNRRDPLLLGLAVAAFGYFLGYYYYALEVTLLAKSAALVITGAIFLAAWKWLSRFALPASGGAP